MSQCVSLHLHMPSRRCSAGCVHCGLPCKAQWMWDHENKSHLSFQGGALVAPMLRMPLTRFQLDPVIYTNVTRPRCTSKPHQRQSLYAPHDASRRTSPADSPGTDVEDWTWTQAWS